LEFFNSDRTPRGKIDMATARYDAKKELLTSKDPVSLVSDDLTASGSSLVYDLENARGFLSGPVVATTKIDQSTSMNTQPVRQAIAAGTLMMAAAAPLPAQEAAPSTPTVAERIAEARLSPDELAGITKESESGRGRVKAAAEEADKALERATLQSENATATLAEFLSAATLTTLLAQPVTPSPATTSNDVPRPNVPEGPPKTRITADDGAFFDSKDGLLIFLKNVVVRDPRFSLTGADEVKVFFDSPEETEAARKEMMAKIQAKADAKADAKARAEGRDPVAERLEAEKQAANKEPEEKEPVEDEKSGFADAKFGEPNKIIATGTVVVEGITAKKGEDPVKASASARTVVYDLKKEQFILRGGSPWFMRNGQVSSVPGNDAYIVITMKEGVFTGFVTGNGGIDAQMELKDKKKEDVKKNR
jgi:lipopolysaccharide export system protein LptA